MQIPMYTRQIAGFTMYQVMIVQILCHSVFHTALEHLRPIYDGLVKQLQFGMVCRLRRRKLIVEKRGCALELHYKL